MRIGLFAKLLLTSVLILTAATVATVAGVSWHAAKTVREDAEATLRGAVERYRAQAEAREAQLRVVGKALATFPLLRDLGATDAATLDDTAAQWKADTGVGLVAIVDANGTLRARSDEAGKGGRDLSANAVVGPALEGQDSAGLWHLGTGAYQVVAIPPLAPGSPVLVVGTLLDDALASTVATNTATDVAFVIDRKLQALGAPAGTQIRIREGLTRALPVMPALPPSGADPDPWELPLGQNRDVHLVERTALLPGDPTLGTAILLVDLEKQLATFRAIRRALVGASFASALLVAFVLWRLAAGLATRIGTLRAGTEKIQAGEFGAHFEEQVRFPDELTDLGASFNRMSDGLRERFEMQKFVSRSTVEAIRRGDQSISRQEICVLFSDVRGFTSFSSTREPEEVVAVINTYLALQAEVVRRHGGDVDKFLGDGMMAVFGGKDGATRAVYCALEIFREIDQLHASGTTAKLGVGIGVAFGPAVVGGVGSAGRQDYTALGSTVNLSSRLCGEAAAGEVLVDAAARGRLDAAISAEALEPIRVKGYAQPVPLFRVRSAKEIATFPQAVN